MHQNKNQNTLHQPVLLDAVLQYLSPRSGESYLDLTAGYGGHARAILERTQAPHVAVLVDRDQAAIEALKQEFANSGAKILNLDFYDASRQLLDGGQRFDVILADLGVSSPHLDDASRGFSFSSDGPLDMRMDQSQALTADKIVNSYKESVLAELIKRYGEEPKAYKIARLIVSHRPLHTTGQLAAVVAKAWPKWRRTHPATQTFQALRIAVNDELGLLEGSLPLWMELLNPGGRLGVVSFHSLEDRLVKQLFNQAGGNTYDAQFSVLTKHPIGAEPQELAFNPRARSAKLRAVAKINKERSLYANSGKKQLPSL